MDIVAGRLFLGKFGADLRLAHSPSMVRSLGLHRLGMVALACILTCVLAGCGEKEDAELPPTFDPGASHSSDTTPTVPDVGDITDVVVPPETDTGDSISSDSGDIDAAMYILATDLYDKIHTDEDAYQIVDIRSFSDYNDSHIEQAVSIPGGKQFELRVGEVDATKTIVLVSWGDYEHVSRAVATLRAEYGSEVKMYVLRGGMQAWLDIPLPVEYDTSLWC